MSFDLYLLYRRYAKGYLFCSLNDIAHLEAKTERQGRSQMLVHGLRPCFLLAPAAEHIGYASELWDENFP